MQQILIKIFKYLKYLQKYRKCPALGHPSPSSSSSTYRHCTAFTYCRYTVGGGMGDRKRESERERERMRELEFKKEGGRER